MEPMESFLQLSGVTIQKIATDPGREEQKSPKQVEDSADSESSDDESVERQDESDCKGDIESDADLSEREEDEPEEENLVTKSEDVDAGSTAEQEKLDVKVEKEGAEEDAQLEVKPSSAEVKTDSKRKKRKKNESERDCMRKKKRKKRNKEPKADTDSDEEKEIEHNKRMKNLRKNIREVMNENELDEETKAAQREEMERLMRVQEQQKMLKEMQRQILLDRQKTLFQSLGQSPSLYRNCTITPMTLNKDAALQQPSSSAATLDDSRYPDCGTTPGGASVTLVHKSKEESLGGASEADPRSLRQLDSLPDISSLCPAPKKASELVTISSSDDDCMIVSGGSEAESEPEDPTNSGLHTNDVFNIPDAQGQVLINVGHPKNEPDIFLAPQVARVIKPHQIGGIRFLYDNVVESLERYKTSSGFGCILAHSMGLGKTLQVVSFCDIFLRKTSARHILCIMPINTLQNWLAEFNMWMPAESAANGDAEPGMEVRPRAFGLFLLNDSQKTLTARAKVIRQWRQDGGVLLIGYELYRLLSLRRDKLSKKKKFINLIDIEDEGNRKKALWSEIHDALIKPGPDLVICDEGHRIKNSHASISHALKSMQTKRRVVLTGYPLQNNLIEYWCMVDFVRPNYLGTKTEFCNMFERPIQNGQCVDSTPNDVKLMRYRAHVLHSLLNGFVQRRSHAVLRDALPQKNEYVMLFRMTPLQRDLYTCFMNDVVRTKAVPNPLKAFAVCCKIWNHPDVLYYFLKKRMEDEDLDLEDAVLAKAAAANVLAKPQDDSPLKNQLQSQPMAEEANIAEKLLDDKSSVLALSQSEGFNQNFELAGEHSGQFNSQYQQDYFNNFQQPSGQFSRQQNSQFQLPHTQNFGEHQSWPQSSYGDNQSLGTSLFHDPYGLPTTLEQHASKNDRLMEMIDKTVNNKEIDSIEKMIDEKIEGKKEEVIKGLLESGSNMPRRGDETSIPYDWATEILKGYEPGIISNSAKMEALFCILEESLKIGDRILLFSQSLFTLNLIEDFLHQNQVPGSEVKWAKNLNYFRLDGSTAAVEREKLINEFNSNPKFHLFLVSTRAGSLGINLVGANRVIVFDASWNPCHDTQAVCRVYRYGQVKQCFVYRFVMDNCLEKKIYDRQINKQGMADRVVDELNPDAHLSIKEVSNLLYDSEPENEAKDLSDSAANFRDDIVQTLLKKHSMQLSKLPFQHESLLVDRKDKKLSQAEKRLAKRSYELEKQASTRPGINAYYGGYQGSYSTSGGGIINAVVPPAPPIRHNVRPVASVRPMQAPSRPQAATGRTRWIPAETWLRQGMTVQEMTLPLDVVIPTNSSDRSISLKAGQRVMVLKSAKGVYMQLENGKIIAIRSTQKSGNDLSSLVDSATQKTPAERIKFPLPLHVDSSSRNNAVETSNWLRSLPWNAGSNMPEIDPHSSNSSSSTSSMNQFVPYDNKFSPLDVPDASKSHAAPPSRLVPMSKPGPSTEAFNSRKSHSNFTQHPPSNTDDLSQNLATMASSTSLRSSGGGIVGSSHPEQQSSGAYPHYPGYNQQVYSDNYGSYHQQADFSTVPATHQYQQQQLQYSAANQYCNPDPFHQPAPTYLNDTFAYQHHQPPPYNSNYSASQNKQQFSQPP